MNQFNVYFLGLLVCISLMDCQTKQNNADEFGQMSTSTINIPEIIGSDPNIKILNEGPTGSWFKNSKRGEFGVLIFRIQLLNDTIVPIDLELKFPSKPIPLLPDSTTKVEVFVLPDSITPDTLQNAVNFGVTGIAEYFNLERTEPDILKTRIEPKESHTLYLGMLAETKKEFGTFRAKLFFNGQNIDAPFLPIKSIKTEQTDRNSLDLIYGIGYSPHQQFTLIPSGHIHFKK